MGIILGQEQTNLEDHPNEGHKTVNGERHFKNTTLTLPLVQPNTPARKSIKEQSHSQPGVKA